MSSGLHCNTSPTRKRGNWSYILAPRLRVGFVSSVLAFLVGCGHPEAAQTPTRETAAPAEPPVVSVSQVAVQKWGQRVRVHGTLLPDETATLGSKVPGRIAKMLVDVGDVIRKGEPVARLDEVQLQLEVRHTEALLAQATAAVGLQMDDPTSQLVPENSPVVKQERAVVEQTKLALDRAQSLRGRNVTTQEELDQREAEYKVAVARHAAALNAVAEKLALIEVRRSEVALAKNAVEESTIIAPFDGIVQQRMTAAGAYVTTGDPVVSMVRVDRVRFLGGVPEKQSELIRVGQDVEIHIRQEEQPRIVQISRLRPLLDEASRALMFEADIANPELQLQPGMFAEADVVVDPNVESVVVPATAIVEFAGVEKVWRVVDGEAQEAPVRTGLRREGQVVVLEGIAVGDTVVTHGSAARAGKVRIENGPIVPASTSASDSSIPAATPSAPSPS